MQALEQKKVLNKISLRPSFGIANALVLLVSLELTCPSQPPISLTKNLLVISAYKKKIILTILSSHPYKYIVDFSCNLEVKNKNN